MKIATEASTSRPISALLKDLAMPSTPRSSRLLRSRLRKRLASALRILTDDQPGRVPALQLLRQRRDEFVVSAEIEAAGQRRVPIAFGDHAAVDHQRIRTHVETQHRGAERRQCRVRFARLGSVHRVRHQVLGNVIEHGGQQAGLVAEVLQQRRLRAARAGEYRVQARVVVAVFHEHAPRDIQHAPQARLGFGAAPVAGPDRVSSGLHGRADISRSCQDATIRCSGG